MKTSDLYLICFGVGALWSLTSLLLGGMHFGHAHAHSSDHSHGHIPRPGWSSWLGVLLSPACIAVFLAWFGGIGYLLNRHSALGRWADLSIAAAVGLTGAALLGTFLRWLQSHELPLEAIDTEMVGVLGKVSSTIRPTGVGEVIYVRGGSRRVVAACCADGLEIPRDEEVVVTRYEKGIAYVRTWAAMTQPEADSASPENSAIGDGNVQ